MSNLSDGATLKKNEPADKPLATLLFNIALPALILYKLSRPERLGPMWALALALVFPLGFFFYDFARRRKVNAISILGFVSILATGSFGLLHLDGKWFAVKEAAIPTLMGIAVIVSLWTKNPLVRTLLYNEKVIDVAKVDRELISRGHTQNFERLLVTTTWMLAGSFLLSAVLNFVLATMIVKSPAGTVAFNEELGKMTATSYGVVVLPCMVVTFASLWRLVSGIRKLTGLDLDTIFRSEPSKKKS